MVDSNVPLFPSRHSFLHSVHCMPTLSQKFCCNEPSMSSFGLCSSQKYPHRKEGLLMSLQSLQDSVIVLGLQKSNTESRSEEGNSG